VGEHSKLLLYAEYLDAGMRSGIDPRKNPRAFRDAANGAQRGVDIGGR
jgi:hypothetical protein